LFFTSDDKSVFGGLSSHASKKMMAVVIIIFVMEGLLSYGWEWDWTDWVFFTVFWESCIFYEHLVVVAIYFSSSGLPVSFVGFWMKLTTMGKRAWHWFNFMCSTGRTVYGSGSIAWLIFSHYSFRCSHYYYMWEWVSTRQIEQVAFSSNRSLLCNDVEKRFRLWGFFFFRTYCKGPMTDWRRWWLYVFCNSTEIEKSLSCLPVAISINRIFQALLVLLARGVVWFLFWNCVSYLLILVETHVFGQQKVIRFTW